ncbi:hypothetical protein BC828DRAFT_199672 [Blastocladiella britannica]|nr:hypothetical protein BC828DRAFT_199672 [Blastocladiella britannica]
MPIVPSLVRSHPKVAVPLAGALARSLNARVFLFFEGMGGSAGGHCGTRNQAQSFPFSEGKDWAVKASHWDHSIQCNTLQLALYETGRANSIRTIVALSARAVVYFLHILLVFMLSNIFHGIASGQETAMSFFKERPRSHHCCRGGDRPGCQCSSLVCTFMLPWSMTLSNLYKTVPDPSSAHKIPRISFSSCRTRTTGADRLKAKTATGTRRAPWTTRSRTQSADRTLLQARAPASISGASMCKGSVE